ncbi:MAG: hypothetical protein IKJ35_06610 [Clostridia bacterium]|nr:hypothetical protein [Clostridia bacterium]
MKLTFTLDNKDFEDALLVSVNGETKDLTEQDKQISFDIPDTDQAIVQVEYKRNDMRQIKNPIGRFFAYVFFFLLSPIIFFADNDGGIGTHNFFCGASPFDLKKTFTIKPNENVFQIEYIPSQYDKTRKMISAPDIDLCGADVMQEVAFYKYDRASFKKDFRMYHYPAYTLLFAVLLAMGAFMTNTLINQFSPFDLIGVVGMSLCVLVVLALLVVMICLFASAHRLFRQVDCNLSNDLRGK